MNFEGKNAVFELLNSSKTIEKLIIEDKSFDVKLKEIFSLAKQKGIKIEKVSKLVLDKISETKHHQGVIAVATDFVYSNLEDVINSARKNKSELMLVLLDGVLDPHNLGSIIRVAECAGASAVVIPKNRSAVVNETVIRVSAGASSHIPICKVGNLVNTIKDLKDKNIWVYAADMDGTKMYDADLKGDIAIVVGSEGNGVSTLVRKECDMILSIPMYGKINSLNASVSAGIMLYEAVRQKHNKR